MGHKLAPLNILAYLCFNNNEIINNKNLKIMRFTIEKAEQNNTVLYGCDKEGFETIDILMNVDVQLMTKKGIIKGRGETEEKAIENALDSLNHSARFPLVKTKKGYYIANTNKAKKL